MPFMAKLVRDWFPARQIGTANGINAAGGALGFSLGLALTYPIFNDQWRTAIYVLHGIFILVTIIWFSFSTEVKTGPSLRSSIWQDLSQIRKLRDIWTTVFISALTMGGGMFFVQLSPVAFITARSANPSLAGTISAFNTVGAFIGNISLSILSDKIGRRKPILIFSPILSGLFLFLAWNAPFGVYTAVFTALSGLFAGGLVSILITVISEHPMVSKRLLGTAIGFRTSVSNIFTYGISVLGGYIVDLNMGFGAAFLYAAILIAVAAIFGIFTSETGSKAKPVGLTSINKETL